MPNDDQSTNTSKSDFVGRLVERARQGHEVPIAALIYALVDADRTSDCKSVYGSAIKWIYHRKYSSVIFSQPELLRYVVDHYAKEHRVDSWGLSAWKAVASTSCHAHNCNYEALGESVEEFIRVLSDSQVKSLPVEEVGRIEVIKKMYDFIGCFMGRMTQDIILSSECYEMNPQKDEIQKYHAILTDTLEVLGCLKGKKRAELLSSATVKAEIIDRVGKLQMTPERYIFEALILRKILDIKVVPWKQST